jgi:hypothetical protein
MPEIQKGRTPVKLWSLQEAAVWVETRAVPQNPILRRLAPAAVQKLHQALKAGTIRSSGCVDGGERRDIWPGEWNDYRLELKHTMFSRHYFMGSAGTPVITVLSIRSCPATAVKYHGYPSEVRIPSASSKDGERDYHRAITDVLMPQDQVVQQWPASGNAPSPNNHSKNESAAIKALSSQLESNPGLTRAEAKTWCTTAGFRLSARGFQNRVWPGARTKAELPEKALPGRKRKSLR